jgi:hypothetical protein
MKADMRDSPGFIRNQFIKFLLGLMLTPFPENDLAQKTPVPSRSKP